MKEQVESQAVQDKRVGRSGSAAWLLIVFKALTLLVELIKSQVEANKKQKKEEKAAE